MADKEPWIGKGTFPRLFIYLCVLVNLLGIAALIILIVTEFIILVNNYQSYVARYGYHYGQSNPSRISSDVKLMVQPRMGTSATMGVDMSILRMRQR
jgi:hypothetical protein